MYLYNDHRRGKGERTRTDVINKNTLNFICQKDGDKQPERVAIKTSWKSNAGREKSGKAGKAGRSEEQLSPTAGLIKSAELAKVQKGKQRRENAGHKAINSIKRKR